MGTVCLALFGNWYYPLTLFCWVLPTRLAASVLGVGRYRIYVRDMSKTDTEKLVTGCNGLGRVRSLSHWQREAIMPGVVSSHAAQLGSTGTGDVFLENLSDAQVDELEHIQPAHRYPKYWLVYQNNTIHSLCELGTGSHPSMTVHTPADREFKLHLLISNASRLQKSYSLGHFGLHLVNECILHHIVLSPLNKSGQLYRLFLLFAGDSALVHANRVVGQVIFREGSTAAKFGLTSLDAFLNMRLPFICSLNEHTGVSEQAFGSYNSWCSEVDSCITALVQSVLQADDTDPTILETLVRDVNLSLSNNLQDSATRCDSISTLAKWFIFNVIEHGVLHNVFELRPALQKNHPWKVDVALLDSGQDVDASVDTVINYQRFVAPHLGDGLISAVGTRSALAFMQGMSRAHQHVPTDDESRVNVDPQNLFAAISW